MKLLLTLVAILSFSCCHSICTGQIHNWTGAGGTDNWSEATNWVGGEVPVSGRRSTVNFSDASLSSISVQNISTNFTLGTLNLSDPASTFRLSGSRITVAAGGSLNFSLPRAVIDNSFRFEPGSSISIDGSLVQFNGDQLVSTAGAPIPVTGNGSIEIGMFPNGPSELGNLQIESGIQTTFDAIQPLNMPDGFSISGPVYFEYADLKLHSDATINAPVQYGRLYVDTSPDSILTINGDITSSEQDRGIGLYGGSTLTGTGDIYPWYYNYIAMGDGAVLSKNIIAVGADLGLSGNQCVFDGDVDIRSGDLDGDFVITGDLITRTTTGFGPTLSSGDIAIGGDLVVVGGLLNFGQLSVSGNATVLQGGDLNVGGHLILANGIQVDIGGTLRGVGQITGDINIDGTFNPYETFYYYRSPLEVDGDINLSSSATTLFVLEGIGVDEFTILRFPGPGKAQLAIDGNVEIQFDDGYLPAKSDEFVVCEGFDISGNFTNAIPSGSIAELSVGDGTIKLEYGPDYLKLREYRRNPVNEPVTSFDVTIGNLISGGLTELAESDNINLVLGRDPFEVLGRIEMVVEGQADRVAPTELALIVESAAFARSPVDQKIEFYNFKTGFYDLIDQRPASRLSQQVVEALVDVDAADYVGAGQAIKARVSFRSLDTRQQYGANLDNVFWQVR